MLYSLIYVSELSLPTQQETLDHIRSQAIELNLVAGITGLLLHTPRHFCQLLQGSKDAVEGTMRRIEADTRHKHPVVVLRTDFPEAMFPDWSMATSEIPAGNTADVIARTHGTRLAQPDDIDQIVAAMQQFRFGIHPEQQAVVFNPPHDHTTPPYSRSIDSNPNPLDSILDLGARLFDGTDLLFIFKQAGRQRMFIRSTNRHLPDSALVELSNSHDEFNRWHAGQLNGYHRQTAKINQSKSAGDSELPHTIYTLCRENGYPGATGSVIIPGAGDEPPDPLNTNDPPAAAIWFLHKTHNEPAQGFESTRENFTRCLEHFLERMRLGYDSEALHRRSQRQQIAISASLQRQELVLNVASSAIIALDKDARVLMINQTARSMFNLDTSEIPFRWPAEVTFLDAGSQEPLSQKLDPVYIAVNDSGGQQTKIDETCQLYENKIVGLKTADGSQKVSLKCSAVAVTESDSAIAVVIVFDDITELELVRNRERIRRSERLEALGHLTGGIAHDFNNLLATVLNSVELANVERQTSERQQLLNTAIDTVHRGAELTNRLVTFAMAQPMKVDVHPMASVLKAVEELAKASVSSDINLVVEEVPESLAVLCDAGQLENALLNLLINSRDAIVGSGIGSTVVVRIQPRLSETNTTDAIEISVIDDGPGMSPVDIRRATDPFFTTKGSSAGSGLGLSMVYRFIQQSGGELQIDNAPNGSGLCVRMIIDQARASSVTQVVTPTHKDWKADQATILLVEDDTSLGLVLKKALEYIGHQVQYFSNPEDVPRLLQGDEDYDLLLTDVVMPDSTYDGFSLAKKAVELRPELKVIYMTGYMQNRNASAPPLFGPILNKPISMNTLSETIQHQLQEQLVPTD